MTDRLSPRPPERLSLNYAALRERGMELIRQFAGDSWTDHNVHDPGITLLEAFCYAMTEQGFRIQQTLPDLLRSGESYGLPNLVPAHQVLPIAPITTADLQRVLLDHPLVNDAQVIRATPNPVPIYRVDPETLQLGDWPLTYEPTAHPLTLGGLYDVLVFFQNRSWNSNTYTLSVTVGSGENSRPYRLEIALPYWDDPEVAPLRGVTVNPLDAVTMQSFESTVWRPLDEAQSHFGRLTVAYNSGETLDLWVILRIVAPLTQSVIETPLILNAAQLALEAVAVNSPIAQFIQRVQAANDGAIQLQRYVESWRHLGEVPVRLQVARQQEIGIRARIQVTGGTQLEELLADIFVAIDRALSPAIAFASLDTMRQQGATPETLYDGPLLRHGFLATAVTETLARSGTIYTSDVLRLIMQRRNSAGTDLVSQENPTGRDIVAVTDLALSNFVNNRPITRDVPDCLTLVEPQRYRPRLSLNKSRITFVRNDLEVAYDLGRVAELIEQRQTPADSPASEVFVPEWPVPIGEALPLDDYWPWQNDLPRLFGVGETGIPEKTGNVGRARSLQTKGYLLLFEQFLADLTAQLSHINSFFSSQPDEPSTYFTRALFDISQTEALLKGVPPERGEAWEDYLADPENSYRQALQTAAETPNQFRDRRNRMFDHLLARQGENMVTWSQELHRWAQKDLQVSLAAALEALGNLPLSPAALPVEIERRRQAAVESRRQAVNARLIRDKAAFLAAAPALNAAKLQAWGQVWQPQVLQRWPELLEVVSATDGFYWLLTVAQEVRLRAAVGLATETAAVAAAELALELASQPRFYRRIDVGSDRYRYQLTDTTDSTVTAPQILGESVRTWETEEDTNAALREAATAFCHHPANCPFSNRDGATDCSSDRHSSPAAAATNTAIDRVF
ncbi:MAG: hypothetical protein F6K00_18780 [Leptolyngbya sp. SIOISBB]|nr:hypothetical protein [Leptolyngbya sp. SIOISBB]